MEKKAKLVLIYNPIYSQGCIYISKHLLIYVFKKLVPLLGRKIPYKLTRYHIR